MYRFSTLPCLLLVMWGTALAAAGPGAPQRRPQSPAPKTEDKAKPKPAPQAASKPAPSKPKPTVAKSEPAREKPAPSTPVLKPTPAPERMSAPRSTASTDTVATRRALRDCGLWLSGVQSQHSDFTARLAYDQKALGRIERDVTLSALPSDRNRNEAAIPAAAAFRAHAQRDWAGQLNASGSRPAPMAVEQLMRQGESIAFRTSTSTADTQGLLAKIRRTPGVAAGGHLGLDAMAPQLLTTHLRIVPGALSESAQHQRYSMQGLEAIRARLAQGREDLDAQFDLVRRDWLTSAVRSRELEKKYRQLRAALVAPDAP